MHALLKSIAYSNHWVLLWPELSLIALGLLLLLIGCTQNGASRSFYTPLLAILGQGALTLCFGLGLYFQEPLPAMSNFAGLVLHSPQGDTMRFFFMLASLGVSGLSLPYLHFRPLARPEFYALLLFISAGLMLLVQSQHFVLLFVALEFVSIGFYILISYCSYSTLSLEAGMKYLILGAFTSTLLLLGIALLYGLATTPPFIMGDGFYFSDLKRFLEAYGSHPMAQLSVIFILLGLAFKIGAFPFQLWVPDVYQGAPTPVTAFLATASKAGGIFVLMNLIIGPLAPMGSIVKPLLSVIAIITLLLGGISALSQRNMKRFLGLSGLSHTAYLLIGLVATYDAIQLTGILIFYIFAYSLASFLVFGCLAYLAKDTDDVTFNLEDLQLMHRRSPLLAGILTIGLGSLAGVPPFVGFVAKLLLFIAVFKAKLYGLLSIAILGVVISIYYYFNWIRGIFFIREKHETLAALRVSSIYALCLMILASLTLAWAFLPQSFSAFISQP